MTIGKDGDKYGLKHRKFCLCRKPVLRRLDGGCKARIAALTLPDRTFNSSSCFSSPVNATPTYLYFSANDTPPTCAENRTEFQERCCSSVFEVLIFILAILHAAAKIFNAWQKLDSEQRKPAKTKSSAKNSRLIFHLPIVTHSSTRLSLSIQKRIMKKRGNKKHPCRKSKLTWNVFDCLPFTWTQTSSWQYAGHTTAALSKAYLEELDYIPFLYQQSMRRPFFHTTRIS